MQYRRVDESIMVTSDEKHYVYGKTANHFLNEHIQLIGTRASLQSQNIIFG
jgi:hypothetical protein